MISLIWAMDSNRLIGANNQMPWSISDLPADMAWFRKHTLGKAVLMGRKTFESIGKPLPRRRNIVLSRQQDLALDGCEVAHSLEEARDMTNNEELMVIGGAEVYAQALPLADRFYITHIDHIFKGDAWFPNVDMRSWVLQYQEQHAPDANNAYPYRFEIYKNERVI